MTWLRRWRGGRSSEVTGSAIAVLAMAVVVFIYAAGEESRRCGPNCYDGPLRTYEPGHTWTAYSSSWQWEAQWALAFLGLALAIVGTFIQHSARLRRHRPALMIAAVVCSVGWIAWRLLEPAIPS
jgi:hypothetical protein